MKPASVGPTVFFDGVCGLCNGFVDFLLRWDRHHLLRFSTLQGPTAARLLPPASTLHMNSVVFLDGERIWQKSAAVGEIMSRLGWPWKVCGWALRLFPDHISNWGYDLVARHRYRIFGKRPACRLPTASERSRFLD